MCILHRAGYWECSNEFNQVYSVTRGLQDVPNSCSGCFCVVASKRLISTPPLSQKNLANLGTIQGFFSLKFVQNVYLPQAGTRLSLLVFGETDRLLCSYIVDLRLKLKLWNLYTKLFFMWFYSTFNHWRNKANESSGWTFHISCTHIFLEFLWFPFFNQMKNGSY